MMSGVQLSLIRMFCANCTNCAKWLAQYHHRDEQRGARYCAIAPRAIGAQLNIPMVYVLERPRRAALGGAWLFAP